MVEHWNPEMTNKQKRKYPEPGKAAPQGNRKRLYVRDHFRGAICELSIVYWSYVEGVQKDGTPEVYLSAVLREP